MLKILNTLCVFFSSIILIDCCPAQPQVIFPMLPDSYYHPQPPTPPSTPSTPSPKNDVPKEGPKMPAYCKQISHKLCQNCYK